MFHTKTRRYEGMHISDGSSSVAPAYRCSGAAVLRLLPSGARVVFPLLALVTMNFSSYSLAMTYEVPEPEKVIKNADVIVVGRFDYKAGYTFIVDEVLKSPTRLPQKMNYDEWVASPLNLINWSIKSAKEKTASTPTIFLGSWEKTEKIIVPIWRIHSFWPQGSLRDNYLPHSTIPELRNYIKDTIKKQKAEEKAKKKSASLHSGVGAAQQRRYNETLALNSAWLPKYTLRVFV